ncbi:hypothetical protein [Dactylosporangium sp. CA-233914]|uniref:hypothetical protein n=1 Tax=Dactylosporangium sp. CA-233914 TaxID=3239934 RepID=UPI003D943294
MKGTRGTAMTMHRLPKRPAPQKHPLLCPVCFSVNGEPCRVVINPGATGTMRRGKALARVHPQRLIPLDQRHHAMDAQAAPDAGRPPKPVSRRAMGVAKGNLRRGEPIALPPIPRQGSGQHPDEPGQRAQRPPRITPSSNQPAAGAEKTNRAAVIRAKQPGNCPSCRGGWRIGTLITMRADVWIHNRCADGERPAPKWTREDTPEARAYRAAAARGDRFLSRRRASWS